MSKFLKVDYISLHNDIRPKKVLINIDSISAIQEIIKEDGYFSCPYDINTIIFIGDGRGFYCEKTVEQLENIMEVRVYE